MLGKTRAIAFPLKQAKQQHRYQGRFNIDRLQWGMTSYNDPHRNCTYFPKWK
ncbi:MAG: hypothetical protein QM664_09570 [Flavihumibacter sp.]